MHYYEGIDIRFGFADLDLIFRSLGLYDYMKKLYLNRWAEIYLTSTDTLLGSP